MIKFSFLVLIFTSSIAFASQTQATTSILLLGDSLSASLGMKQNQGWVHILNQQLAEQKSSYTIINASISGETTAGGLARLPGILSRSKIDHLIIELGGNDGLRGFAPTLIKNNLLQIIALAKQKNIPVSIIDIQIPPNYGPRYNKLFNAVFAEVADETESTLLPFFMETIAIKPELMQADGIHPNVDAQNKIANFVGQQVKTLMTKSKVIE